MTHITSYRNVISIEHTASAIFVAFWLVLPFREGRIFNGLVKNIIACVVFTNFQDTLNYILFNISASGLFLKYS